MFNMRQIDPTHALRFTGEVYVETLIWTFSRLPSQNFLVVSTAKKPLDLYVHGQWSNLNALGDLNHLRESWKDRDRARLQKKSGAKRCIICICFCALNFFPEIALGHGLRKWHIFLFSLAYFTSYQHTPFQTSNIN